MMGKSSIICNQCRTDVFDILMAMSNDLLYFLRYGDNDIILTKMKIWVKPSVVESASS